MNRCDVAGARSYGMASLQLQERARQRVRVAAQLRARGVRAVLTRAAHRQLQQRGRDGRHQQQAQVGQRPGQAAALVIVTPAEHAAAEPEEHLRRVADDARERRRHRADERVPVVHVAQLVRQHALQLAPVQDVHDARRHRDGRVARVAARGERVRLRRGQEVDLRLRHARARGQPLHHLMQPRRLLIRQRLRAVDGQRDAVAEPVRAEVHHHREEARHRQALRSAEPLTDDEHQRRQARQQHGRLQCVAQPVPPAALERRCGRSSGCHVGVTPRHGPHSVPFAPSRGSHET